MRLFNRPVKPFRLCRNQIGLQRSWKDADPICDGLHHTFVHDSSLSVNHRPFQRILLQKPLNLLEVGGDLSAGYQILCCLTQASFHRTDGGNRSSSQFLYCIACIIQNRIGSLDRRLVHLFRSSAFYRNRGCSFCLLLELINCGIGIKVGGRVLLWVKRQIPVYLKMVKIWKHIHSFLIRFHLLLSTQTIVWHRGINNRTALC